MDIKAVKEDRQGKVPYEFIRDIYETQDPIKMAELSGTVYDAETKKFKVTLMGKDYWIEYPTGKMVDGDYNEIESYTIRTIILRYLVNAKGIEAAGKDITYKEIPGGHVYYSNFYNRTVLQLAKEYGYNIEAFKKSNEKINGKLLKIGDAACRFEFINNVYMTFIVWEGDEEFSPASNILFDFSTQYCFDAEDLAVVGDIAVAVFKRQGDLPKRIGLYQTKPQNKQ
ncbi:MAG: DUF3786 domain-containing protein [Clostridiaceae bacterium]|nr:DUF3786 domain-containing protein [Clostridiaceae bacterium]